MTVFDRDASLAPAPHLPIAVAADLRWAEPVDAIHQVGIELKPIFRSAQLLGESSNLTADVPGRITLDAYPGEDYAVTITGAPAGAYVKQLKYGTADLTAETFRPGTQMDNSLHIVLGRDGGSLDTQVVDKEGLPIPHSTVVVYDEQLTDLPRLAANVVLGQTDQFGRWQSPALAPGKYRVCALLSDLVKSPEMLAQLLRSRKDSVGVEIGSRSESLMTLQPITLR